MKRGIFFLIIFFLTPHAFAAGQNFPPPALGQPVLPGDINGSGQVTILDVTLASFVLF